MLSKVINPALGDRMKEEDEPFEKCGLNFKILPNTLTTTTQSRVSELKILGPKATRGKKYERCFLIIASRALVFLGQKVGGVQTPTSRCHASTYLPKNPSSAINIAD